MKHFMIISLPFSPATVWHNLFFVHFPEEYRPPGSKLKTTYRERNFNLIHWDSSNSKDYILARRHSRLYVKFIHNMNNKWNQTQSLDKFTDVEMTSPPQTIKRWAHQYHLHSLDQILHPPPASANDLMANTASLANTASNTTLDGKSSITISYTTTSLKSIRISRDTVRL